MHAEGAPLHRRQVLAQRIRSRPPGLLSAGVAGFVVTTAIVVAGGRVGPIANTVPLSHWLGLLSVHAIKPTRNPYPGTALALGILAFVALWLWTIGAARRHGWTPGQLGGLATGWALPLMIGPPLLSSDVFSYAAQGILVAHGHSPYTASPWAIYGNGPASLAVDPIWLFVHSPYGPLATLLEHAAVLLGGGSALGAVIVLRIFAIVSVAVIGVLVVRLVPRERTTLALMLTVANPLVLLQLLSAAHFEAEMCALLLAALLASMRGRPYLALALGCAAGAIKAPALIIVFAIAFEMWHSYRQHDVRAVLARGAAVVGVSWLVFTVLVPNGWGWLRSLNTPGLGTTAAAPSSWFARVLSPILPSSSTADLVYAGRVAALGAAMVIVGYLLVTAHLRALASTAGLGLLAVSFLGPVFYPWYATWGLVCLVVVLREPAAEWLVLLSAFVITIALPGQTVVSGAIVTWGAAALAGLYTWSRWRAARRAAPSNGPPRSDHPSGPLPVIAPITAPSIAGLPSTGPPDVPRRLVDQPAAARRTAPISATLSAAPEGRRRPPAR